ncbi:hypothetical protein DPEC_G00303480, partial [Dallia pectoralis]
IKRATSEIECWEIFDNTIPLIGNGGECRSISFICTKTDIVDKNKKEDVRTSILNRNTRTKDKVKNKFHNRKEVKKHFSGGKDFFRVITASSKEYNNKKHLAKNETEIPQLQEILISLNDHRTRTSDYIFGAGGILSLIQAAKNSKKTDNRELCQILEERLNNNLKSISKSMDESCKEFDQCLLRGVEQSKKQREALLNNVISPQGKKGGGYYNILMSLCKKGGIHKQRRSKNRGKELNLNESLASCMRKWIDEEFKNLFPNDKCGPIRELD